MMNLSEDESDDCTLRPSTNKSSERTLCCPINAAFYIERPGDDEDRSEDGIDSRTFDADDFTLMDEIQELQECGRNARRAKIIDPDLQRQREEQYRLWWERKREEKRKEKQERERELREQELKEREMEVRRKRSKEKVREWHLKKSATEMRATTLPPGGKKKSGKPKPRKLKGNQLGFDTWLEKKCEAERAEKQRLKEEAALESKIEDFKKGLSEKFFFKWNEMSQDKPKPVPFGHGFASLAACTSAPYTNPTPWID